MTKQVTDTEFKALISLLDDTDNEVFTHVSNKLFSLGVENIPLLESAWEIAENKLIQTRLETLIQSIQFANVKDLLEKWIQTGGEDLLEGALIVAKYQYPDLEEQEVIQKIDHYSKSVWLELNPALSALEEAHVISNVIYNLYGFVGLNNNHKPDPEIGYINNVIQQKKGNSLSLSILYLILAQKNDLPFYGVNLPYHFIMCYTKKHISTDELALQNSEKKIMFYINPLSKGIAFSRSEITNYLEQMKIKTDVKYYSPCSNLEIIKMLLYNQLSTYDQIGNKDKAAQLKELYALFLIPNEEIE